MYQQNKLTFFWKRHLTRGIAALHAAKRMWSCLIWTLPPETTPSSLMLCNKYLWYQCSRTSGRSLPEWLPWWCYAHRLTGKTISIRITDRFLVIGLFFAVTKILMNVYYFIFAHKSTNFLLYGQRFSAFFQKILFFRSLIIIFADEFEIIRKSWIRKS